MSVFLIKIHITSEKHNIVSYKITKIFKSEEYPPASNMV